MANDELTFEITDSAADLAMSRSVVLEQATKAGFSEADSWDIVTAVFEACANAVTHGQDSPGGCARLSVHTDRGYFEAIVWDPGTGFNCPSVSPMPPATSHRGRGIPLMRAVMDEVSIESSGGCSVRLVKRLTKQPVDGKVALSMQGASPSARLEQPES